MYHPRRIVRSLAPAAMLAIGLTVSACVGPSKPTEPVAVSTGSEPGGCGLTITIQKVTAYDDMSYDWTLNTAVGATLQGDTKNAPVKQLSGSVSNDKDETTDVVIITLNEISKDHTTHVKVFWTKGQTTADALDKDLPNPAPCPTAKPTQTRKKPKRE